MSQHHRRLLKEWQRLCARYGIEPDPEELRRLTTSSNRRMARLNHLRLRIEEIQSEIETLETEVSGIETTADLVLSELISEALERHTEGWSPVPVLGYRLWDIGPSGLHGYRQRWDSPSLSAYCPRDRSSHEVPHTDGRCGDPPCGIYAAKDASRLAGTAQAHPRGRLAMGLVALSGKVVEHEKGYRAAQAEVLALGVPQLDRSFLTGDSWQIDRLFTDPNTISVLLEVDSPLSPADKGSQYELEEVITFLESEQRRQHDGYWQARTSDRGGSTGQIPG